jgi:hypothetical protein
MAQHSRTILDLETRFWQSMVDKDAKTAKAMIADECLITGARGAMKLDPGKYEAMAEDGQWRLDSFEFSDAEVIFPSDDVAVVAYKVRQKGEMQGKAMDMQCADSSTWVRKDDAWKCALHTETVLQS